MVGDNDALMFWMGLSQIPQRQGQSSDGQHDFDGRISISVDAGNPPDIADFPQPGLLANFARQGHIVDPTSWMSEDWLQQQYNQSWLDMAKMEGPDGGEMTGGTWYRFNSKSLVWYPKAQFEAAGHVWLG